MDKLAPLSEFRTGADVVRADDTSTDNYAFRKFRRSSLLVKSIEKFEQAQVGLFETGTVDTQTVTSPKYAISWSYFDYYVYIVGVLV